MSNWFGSGLAAAAGSLVGLFVGGAIGSRSRGQGITGVPARIEGASVGAVSGMILGAFVGGAVGAAIPGPAAGTTLVVAPPATPPTPALPPGPPAPGTPAADPILTDAQSIYAARNYLGTWWAAMLAQNPAAVNSQSYVPVLTLTNGVLAPDPNFVSALAFFQQFVNVNATPADFAAIGLSVTQLPYTNGTLDTYSLQLLQAAAANPSAV